MNDIDIVYDKKEKLYYLDIETAYAFDNYENSCNYLKECLNKFTKYMKINKLNINNPYNIFFSNLSIDLKANTIEELYTNFKIFVNGYCSFYINTSSNI